MHDPGKQGSPRYWRHSVLAGLFLLTAVSVGCNQLASTPAPEAPDPTYQSVIANYFKTTFKTYASYKAFEISTPRWVHGFQGWNWLICVRFLDGDRRRTYVLTLNGTNIVDAHYAVQTDDCGAQAYSVFEPLGGVGLEPLH